MYLPRQLNLIEATAHKSCFLFSPRQTGKSMLLRQTLPKGTPIYDLLDHRVWLVGGGGVDLEEFLLRPATDWFV